MTEAELTQQQLAQDLGYKTQSAVSKFLSGRSPFNRRVANDLQQLFGNTSLGVSFPDLWRHFHDSQKEALRSARDATIDEVYDVFLASPMASADGDAYGRERKSALDVCRALELHCGFRVYYAGRQLSRAVDFDAPEIAAELNFAALENSRYFVLLMMELPKSPSSVFVEAGFALAWGKPSLYIVPDHTYLPYVLQTISQTTKVLPPTIISPVPDIDRALGLLERHKERLFDRLEERRARILP